MRAALAFAIHQSTFVPDCSIDFLDFRVQVELSRSRTRSKADIRI